jgi:cytochrome b561
MQLKNTEHRYGLVTRANHWLNAVIMISVIALGIYMVDLPREPATFELYGLHKSLGVLLLALIIWRLIWLKRSPNPPLLPSKPWEHTLAHSVRGLLYLAMIIAPLSGWLMSNSAGHGVDFFGLFNLPTLVAENESLNAIVKPIHVITGKIVLPILILLHIGGALKHHFVYKDATLKRMLGRD